MAIPGQTIAASVRTNAIGVIERIADSARSSASGAQRAIASAHLTEPTIVGSTAAQIEDANRFLEHAVVWANDMNCFARASVGARHINEVLGRGTAPTDDAVNAAVAILKAPPDRGWSFHAGIAMRDGASGEVRVIDHLTEPQHLRLRDWADMYGVQGDDVSLVSPWGGSKVKSTATDASAWNWIENVLVKTWKEAPEWDVAVREAGGAR